MYKTTCPRCQTEDSLRVVGFVCSTSIPLHADGFATADAKFFDTDHESVNCVECGAGLMLSDLFVDEEE